MAPKRVLVTGDHGIDYNIYRYSDEDNPPANTPPTIVRASIGGSGIIHRVLQEAAAASSGAFDVEWASTTQPGSPMVAIWHPDALGATAKNPADKDDKKTNVWRTMRSVSLGHVDHAGLLPAVVPMPPTAVEHRRADVVVIEDDGAGFRFTSAEELRKSIPQGEGAPELVVLKTTWPLCFGPLWWHLTGSLVGQSNLLPDRLVVVLAIKDLRRADVRLSQAISWERTAEDLVRELTGNAALSELRRAQHVVITLGAEGALWMRRETDGTFRFRLFFDRSQVENEWSDTAAKGNAYGFNACFTSAVVAHLTMSGIADMPCGIERGLLATRALRILGHGPAKAPSTPELPAVDLGAFITAKDLSALAATSHSKIDFAKLGLLGSAEIPAPRPGGSTGTWRILEASDCAQPGQPLFGKAHRVALFGAHELRDIPCARFGLLVTVDRDEIEALRNLNRLMKAYADDATDKKPLSLAVFGPPGAGKSFGVKQIVETVIPADKRALLEFNLSQFKNADDLIGAFHQVRDRVLEGKLPVVFWDEFDSRSYDWLQFLLAPMQDGKFQEGQLTHPIGRCIFVFAGATTYTYENFGPPEHPVSDSPDDVKAHRAATDAFVLKKGPDFRSRLHGTLNVLGPNPRLRFNGRTWEDDPTDVCFPVRRAVLLRSLLRMMDPKHESDPLAIDTGLLSALLEVGHYRYGSRSFEKIVLGLAGAKGGYQRSALPSDEVLEMNVKDLAAFKRVLDQPLEFQRHAELLAAAIHARWLNLAAEKNAFRVEFEKLAPEPQNDNRAAASRVPAILSLVGLELVEQEDPRPAVASPNVMLTHHLERLAEAEHAGWMDVRLKNGWTYIEHAEEPLQGRNRAARMHDCLKPYSDLPQKEKEKDREAIRWYPEMAKLAGFKIVAKGSQKN